LPCGRGCRLSQDSPLGSPAARTCLPDPGLQRRSGDKFDFPKKNQIGNLTTTSKAVGRYSFWSKMGQVRIVGDWSKAFLVEK
jgi:hypothetical protein